jgi:hypothetical protein
VGLDLYAVKGLMDGCGSKLLKLAKTNLFW